MRKKHVKVTIPEKDQAVMLWLQEQMNMSYSIRTLIKRHIVENGGELVDVTCESLDSLAGRVITIPGVGLDESPKVRGGGPGGRVGWGGGWGGRGAGQSCVLGAA